MSFNATILLEVLLCGNSAINMIVWCRGGSRISGKGVGVRFDGFISCFLNIP